MRLLGQEDLLTHERGQLADVARLARRLVYRAVDAARTEDKPLRRLLLDHLGADADGLPSVSGSWPTYQHVNLQAGLDAWLAGPARRFELVGIAGAAPCGAWITGSDC